MEVKREWFEKDYYAVLESHLTLLKSTFKKPIESWPETSIQTKTQETPKLKNDLKMSQQLTM